VSAGKLGIIELAARGGSEGQSPSLEGSEEGEEEKEIPSQEANHAPDPPMGVRETGRIEVAFSSRHHGAQN
jgi:hypothetical protein